MAQPVPNLPRKGRGSVSNRSGRFEAQARHAVDDGWARDEDMPPPATVLGEDASRTIIARNTSPDVPFDRSINPYRGCEHGCVYCFARPTHAWLGLSPGLDFESKILVKLYHCWVDPRFVPLHCFDCFDCFDYFDPRRS